MMTQIGSDLHLIDLGGVNAYLWLGTGGPTLIDTGYPWSKSRLVAAMVRLGVNPGSLQHIIITHADIDHVGGLRSLLADTEATVCCHAAEVPLIQGKRRKGAGPGILGRFVYLMAGLAERFYQPATSTVDEICIDGQSLAEGFLILHMPGHSPGQIALLHEEHGILIAGDSLSNRGNRLSLPPRLATPRIGAARESLGKLTKYEYEVACFGHGPPLLHDASSLVNSFLQTL